MNPMMMIPHQYKIKKPAKTKKTTTQVRYSGSGPNVLSSSPSPSMSKLNLSLRSTVGIFADSGGAEKYDTLCWCD